MKKFFASGIVFISALILLSCNKGDTPSKPDPPVKPTEPEVTTPTPWTHSTPFPFDMPALATLRSSQKKVFAHYFTPYPIQIDNVKPDMDYYTKNYLSPTARDVWEQKWNDKGGLLRTRPLPVTNFSDANYVYKNLEEEVRRANAIGLDGFTVDILGAVAGDRNFDWAAMLCDAANAVDPTFKIVLMPDMEVFKNLPMASLENCIKELGKKIAVFKLDDGRLVISPFNSQVWDAAKWQTFLTNMKTAGTDIVFYPLFQNWKAYAPSFASISYGMSDWGEASVTPAKNWTNTASDAHGYGAKWMMPVRPQDMRPKELVYSEASNSELFRVMWDNSIKYGSDWVQLITWNDYSETTSIAPSTGINYSFYDLTAFYSTWFKTGTQPVIQREVLYYFYRPQTTSATVTAQSTRFNLRPGGDGAKNEIELLAFLKEPGTLQIEIGGQKLKKDVGAGVTSFKVPAAAGKPVFRLIRNSKDVIILPGKYEIKTSVTHQNLTYNGGSNSRQDDYDAALDYKQ